MSLIPIAGRFFVGYKSGIILFSLTILLLSMVTANISLQTVRAATENQNQNQQFSVVQLQQYDQAKNCVKNTALVPNMSEILTNFNCGHTTFFQNGTTLRQFTLIIEENHKLPISMKDDTNGTIFFPSWTFNSSIPGPIMRVTLGDKVQVKVINKGSMPHSLHMHSIHPGVVDGVPIVSGDSGLIPPGHQFIYNFTAAPVGIFPYHCHMSPIQEHINRGLYGGLIIDPPLDRARPAAHEIVMFLNGYDLAIKNTTYPRLPTAHEANQMMNGNTSIFDTINNEHDNAVYSVNGIANYYMHNPIPVKLNEPLRIYMFNMLDFETNSFHLHGQVYDYYPSGTTAKPAFKTDMIMMDQGDRGIIETVFHFPGKYMAHAHRDSVGGRGWSSLFSVS